MIHICSYCRKFLGEKEPYDKKEYTHGMCRDCYDHMMRQMEGISFDEYLEGFEFPVMLVNDEGRLVAANHKVLNMFDKPVERVRGFLGGEAFECAYARLEEGCGNTVHCPACTIRVLVNKTRDENCSYEDQQVFLITDQGKLEIIVSTSNINGMVRIVIKEAAPAQEG